MAAITDDYIEERGGIVWNIDHAKPDPECPLCVYKDKDAGTYFVLVNGLQVEITDTSEVDAMDCVQDLPS